MWKEGLESKYESWRNLNSRTNPKYESWWWRDLRKICGESSEGSWFDENIRWKIGSGLRVRF